MAQGRFTKKKSVFPQLSSKAAEAQFGNKEAWRFKSVTTPGHSFNLVRALSEFVILQRYGRYVPPRFWYKKTNCPKMRSDFLSMEKQIAAMIYRKESITALQLLSIVCERFTPEAPVEYKVDDSKKEEPFCTMVLTQNEVNAMLNTNRPNKTMREIIRDNDG